MLTLTELTGIWPSVKATCKSFEAELPLAADLQGQHALLGLAVLATGAWIIWWLMQKQAVYLINFQVFVPPSRMRTSHDRFMQGARQCKEYTAESLNLMDKLIRRSGVGHEAAMPDELHRNAPWELSMAICREEAELVMFTVVQQALAAAGITPRQVDILIVNCSVFCPTPSLSAMIVNRFRMRCDIISYSLGGMGCSAGLLSISLARELLQVYPRRTVLVVSTENISQNVYLGNNRSMLVPGCIFRVGGAAIVLSNRWQDRFRAKYQLQHVVRTHAGANDDAYRCVFQEEDDDGNVGISLSKELMTVAGNTLKQNIVSLGPLVLPYIEQLRYACNIIARKVFKMKRAAYIPNFASAFDHICFHTGGKAVIDALEKQLSLPPRLVQPSRDVLWRYGNTSSASIWYVLAYLESTDGVQKRSRTWQVAFGSGFKVNSAVWKALRNNKVRHPAFAPDNDVASAT